MNKIKTFFIHLFGGITLEESEELSSSWYKAGKTTATKTIHKYMQTCYGLPPEEWSASTYDYVSRYLQVLEPSE